MNSGVQHKKLIISILSLIVLLSSSLISQNKKYVLFNNLDPDFAQTAYYENFQKYDGLKDYEPYAISLPFNASTFAQYNITDFDMAIFPMGDNALSYSSGGHKVITKIKEMIAAGKNVLVTGRTMLYRALAPGGSDKDPEVVDFLENTMGIDYIHRKDVHKVEGNTTTWWSYIIHGHDPDPVGKSIRKGCNFETYNGWPPLAYYMSLDIFFSKDKEKYPQVEHFIYHDGLERNDTIVAIRTEVGESRLILYSMGFEAYCGEIPRGSLLHRCMLWALGNIKPDGPVLQFDPVNLDFERVKVDSSRDLEFVINSIGKEELEITETSFFDNPDDVFTIVEGEVPFGGTPITLKNGESHKLKVRFTPKDKKEYAGMLSVYSNSITGNIKDLNCAGIGGQENSGPKVATNFGKKIDFGQLRLAKSETFELKFYNPGDKELTVQMCRMDTNMADHDLFTFPQVLATPFFVQPGDSIIVKVKFAATKNEYRIYTGKILIECDALNDPVFEIDLTGEIIEGTSVDEDVLAKLDINIIPMPVQNEFRIDINNNYTMLSNANIYISDLLGAKVKNIFSGSLASGFTGFDVNSTSMASGIYLLVAEVGSRKIVKRIVVSK